MGYKSFQLINDISNSKSIKMTTPYAANDEHFMKMLTILITCAVFINQDGFNLGDIN